MAKIVWDASGSKWIHTGVDKVNLRKFAAGTPGVGGTCAAWNGVTVVTTTPSGAEVTKLYADNILYMEMMSVEEVAASIEAYAYPKAFNECNGIVAIPVTGGGEIKVKGQKRRRFSLAWRSREQDDAGNEHEILHILYDCQASPSEVQNSTISDSPEALTYSWEITCNPLPEFTLTTDDTVPVTETYKNVYKLDIDLDEYVADLPTGKTLEDLLEVFEDDADTVGWTPRALANAGLLKGFAAAS